METAVFESVVEYETSFTAVFDGKQMSIPMDEANADYQALKAWIEAGGTVMQAVKPSWMLQQ